MGYRTSRDQEAGQEDPIVREGYIGPSSRMAGLQYHAIKNKYHNHSMN